MRPERIALLTPPGPKLVSARTKIPYAALVRRELVRRDVTEFAGPGDGAEGRRRIKMGKLRMASPHGSLSRRPPAAYIVATTSIVVLAVAGVAVAGRAAGWWASGQPVLDKASVAATFNKPGLKSRVDLSRARSVASSGQMGMVAVPEVGGGFCVAPTLQGETDLPVVCDDAKGAESHDVFISWSLPGGVDEGSWAVAGRTGKSGAEKVLAFGLAANVTDQGFFFAAVPAERWAQLSRASGRVSILNSAGNEVGATCAHLSDSPNSPGMSGKRESETVADFSNPPC
jgi:hypothetical protein